MEAMIYESPSVYLIALMLLQIFWRTALID